MIEPPGNSLAAAQNACVADTGDDLAAGLRALLGRVAEEIAFNDAKGMSPYRLGVHDALRFSEDALANLLRRHGHDISVAARELDT